MKQFFRLANYSPEWFTIKQRLIIGEMSRRNFLAYSVLAVIVVQTRRFVSTKPCAFAAFPVQPCANKAKLCEPQNTLFWTVFEIFSPVRVTIGILTKQAVETVHDTIKHEDVSLQWQTTYSLNK